MNKSKPWYVLVDKLDYSTEWRVAIIRPDGQVWEERIYQKRGDAMRAAQGMTADVMPLRVVGAVK